MMAAKQPERSLTELPDLSIALREALTRAGLRTPEALRLAGAEAAWNLLRLTGFSSPIQTILALEAAIQGVPCQRLPADRQFELVRFAAGRFQ